VRGAKLRGGHVGRTGGHARRCMCIYDSVLDRCVPVFDVGFTNRPEYLALYKGEIYHSSSIAMKPSFKEKFNRGHLSIQNARDYLDYKNQMIFYKIFNYEMLTKKT
jgi:hypothetical protein